MRTHIPRLINFILGILMLLIVVLCVCGTGAEYAYKKTFELPNILYMTLGVVCFAIMGIVTYKLGALLEKCKYSNWIMLLLNGLFFLGLVILTYHYYFKTGWDAQYVEWAAKAIAERNWEAVQNKYFSYYPNNVFLVFLFSSVARMGMLIGINNYYFCFIIFQCAIFATTGYLLYVSAKECLNIRIALAVWGMYILLIGLSPWVVVPYSDATGLLFPTLLFYLYIKISKGTHVAWWIGCFSFLSYVGYRIKPQIAIVAIAVLIVTLFSVRKSWFVQRKNVLWKMIACMVGIILGIVLVNVGVKATHLELEDGLTFGLPHYVMMGLNEECGGVINIVDQNFSMQFTTVEERNAANLQVAKERVKELGVGGLLKLWKNKMLTNFTDGTFAWWQEGGFYAQEMYEGNNWARSFLTDYYYEGRGHHEWFKNTMQTLWMGTLLFSFVGTILDIKNKEQSELDVLKLSLIGIIIFEMLFEARARYIFIYAPLFILWAHAAWKKYMK